MDTLFSLKTEEDLATYAKRRLEVEIKVTKFLIDLKCPPHYSGYTYLKDIIVQVIMANNKGKTIDKTVWQNTAAKFGTSANNIERCVRTMINAWWDRFRVSELFPEKPTCRECALLCAEYISLGLSPDYETPNGKKK